MSKSNKYVYGGQLWHHGILGQRWGKRNGPPYPLDAKDHSASEKRAGWRKSLDGNKVEKANPRKVLSGKNSSEKPAAKNKGGQEGVATRKGLTDKQKKALIIGGATITAVLATYGAYKLGAFDKREMPDVRNVVDNVLSGDGPGSLGNQPIRGLLAEMADAGAEVKSTAGKIKETLEESLRNANPLFGSNEGINNCTCCSIAGILRTMGYDATAKSTGGKMQILSGMLEECFKGKLRILERRSLFAFKESPESAAAELIKRFGNNARGVMDVRWPTGSGHAFSWIIKDGKVQFLDFQQRQSSTNYWRMIWNHIDKMGYMTIGQIPDDVEINFEALSRYVDVK